jgi:hypothetical protein
MTTYFCDGIKGISILNGVARIEFHRLLTTDRGAGQEAQTVPELVLALPTQGLLQALSMLERVRDGLIKEGLLKPGDGAALPPSQPAKSPNFS